MMQWWAAQPVRAAGFLTPTHLTVLTDAEAIAYAGALDRLVELSKADLERRAGAQT